MPVWYYSYFPNPHVPSYMSYLNDHVLHFQNEKLVMKHYNICVKRLEAKCNVDSNSTLVKCE